jgi:copper transport protein
MAIQAGAGFLLFMIMLLMTADAWSHAVLLETLPAAGSAVAASPDAVILRFNVPVVPISVRLLDSSGGEVAAAAEVSATDSEISLPLTAPLEQGQYLLSYRATSLDSHLIRGSFTFAVGTAAPAPVLSAAPAPPSAPWVEWAAHLPRGPGARVRSGRDRRGRPRGPAPG